MTGFKIVDSRTGERATQATYLSVVSAWSAITAWQDRHDKGGRPDVSLDLLLHLAVEVDA